MFTTWRTVLYHDRYVHCPVSSYDYQPWTNDEPHIRLIKIHSSRGAGDELVCSLHTYSLSDVPAYIALSYEWGDPSQWRVIYLDNIPFPVTINLHAALIRLSNDNRMPFWIDAICVDQDDKDERTAYLPLMRQIFNTAGCVFVWLGTEENGSGDAFKALERNAGSKSSLARTGRLPEAAIKDLRNHKQQLFDLARRTYWRRVWVIQEVAVANQVILLCGTSCMQWNVLDRFLSCISKDKTILDTNLVHIQHLRQSRSDFLSGRQVGTLQLLYRSRASQATDTRDKVYALLGLITDSLDFINRPSYSLRRKDIAIDIIKTCARRKKTLDIIFLASHESAMPSWVPDFFKFGEDPVQRCLSDYISRASKQYRCGNYGYSWRASSESIFDIDNIEVLFTGYSFLQLFGYKLGTINGVGASRSPGSWPQHSNSSFARRSPEANRKINNRLRRALTLYSRSYPREAAACLNFLFEFDDCSSYSRFHTLRLRKLFEAVRHWRRQNKSFSIRNQDLFSRCYSHKAQRRAQPWRFSSLSDPADLLNLGLHWFSANSERPSEENETILHALQTLIEEGLLLVSTEEDDIGWAHPAARPGDVLYLLEGCSMPAVLRPSRRRAGQFSLVGHAYVVGVMMGEVWSRLNASDLQTVVIS